MNISDIEFEQFKAGDQVIFRKVFDLFHKAILGYIYSFTKNKEDAEEFVQEAYVSLFIHRENIQAASGIYPYLFVTTKRMMISDFRKKVVRAKFQNHLAYSWNEASSETEEHLINADLLRTLDKAIDELPSKEQEVYRLNKLEGLSYHEISDLSGASKNTIKNQLISASKKIKWKIEKIYLLIFFTFFL